MSSLEDMESLNREELLALLAELQRQVAELTTSNASLRSEIAELQRSTKRQAAPFSKGTRVSNPKRPGRQPSEGTFSFRQVIRNGKEAANPVDLVESWGPSQLAEPTETAGPALNSAFLLSN